MTNGEKIMQAFPDLQIDMGELEVYMWTTTHDAIDIPLDWWNAEYKEPTIRNCYGCKYSKDNHNAGTEECHLCMWENQYTPTTKTCRTCRNFGSHHGICEIYKDNKCWTEKEPRSFKWCTDCKEYDQEKHCCHRYSKVIRDVVAEIEQEPVLDKINKMKSEIADSLEFWDYSPNNNPLARDMLETLTNFWGDMKEVEE